MQHLITDHAVVRYIERIKSIYDPTPKDLRRFRLELERFIDQFGVLSDEQPHWIGIPPPEEDVLVKRASLYLVLSDDICIPMQDTGTRLIGLTFLVRGNISTARRELRNERKRERRKHRANTRAHRAWLGESQPRWR